MPSPQPYSFQQPHFNFSKQSSPQRESTNLYPCHVALCLMWQKIWKKRNAKPRVLSTSSRSRRACSILKGSECGACIEHRWVFWQMAKAFISKNWCFYAPDFIFHTTHNRLDFPLYSWCISLPFFTTAFSCSPVRVFLLRSFAGMATHRIFSRWSICAA